MKKLMYLMLFVPFLAYGQVSIIPTETGSNSGDGEIKAIIAQAQANDDVLVDTSEAIRSDANTNTAAAALNTTHRGLTNDPHSVTAEQAGAIAKEDTVDGKTVVKILTDTSTYFSRTIGKGNDGDTINFTLNNVVWGTKWNGSHTLNITRVTGVVYGTSPDIDIALLSDVNFRDGTPTTMLSADLTITSTTTGSTTTSFSDATVAPGDWLWIRIDQATAKPKQFIFTIDGFLAK